MGHVTRDTDRAAIDIDTVTGQILIAQKWAYRWHVEKGLSGWTQAEKTNFHRRSDLAVWAVWSNHAKFAVSGSSPFAQRFKNRLLPINLDIRWVLTGQHWTVNVTKVPASKFYPSQVFWAQRVIQLGSHDYAAQERTLGKHKRYQRTVAHEYGHAAGNTGVLNRGDEYPKPSGPASPHVKDETSIMHVGEELRRRHFITMTEELNRMIPAAIFRLASLS